MNTVYRALRSPSSPPTALLCCLLLILMAPACGNSGDQAQVREVNKWNHYVELHTDIQQLFFPPLDTYFSAFGRAAEYRTAAEQHSLVSFVSTLPSFEDFENNIQKTMANAKKPENALDEAAREMLPPLIELLKLLAQTRDYHAAQEYNNDDYAQAHQLHAQIHAANAAFMPPYQQFSQLLQEKNTERRKTDIKAMQAQNLHLKATMLSVVDAAQKMQDYFHSQRITAETMVNLDPEYFMVLFGDYVSAGDKFLALGIEADELIKEGLKKEGLYVFRINLKEVLAKAAPIIAYCRNAKKATDKKPIKQHHIENFNISIINLGDSYNISIK